MAAIAHWVCLSCIILVLHCNSAHCQPSATPNEAAHVQDSHLQQSLTKTTAQSSDSHEHERDDDLETDDGDGWDEDELGDDPEDHGLNEEEFFSQEQERRPLVYLTREDRREAGIKHEIYPWLTVAGLLELEWLNERLKPREPGPQSRDQELALVVQGTAIITPTEWSKLELIYEYEDDDEFNRHRLDEALLSVEYDDWELEGGRFYMPFGEYFSHFIDGPVLELAETRASGINLSYAPGDSFDVAVFAYQGNANPIDATGDEIDWGFALQYAPGDFGTLGLSYISDLADSADSVIDPDELPYLNKVDGLSGYAVFGVDQFEFNLEFVAALDDFQDLEGDRNRPIAWNTEVAYYPTEHFEVALRVEGSKEIEDAPHYRTGIAAAWWMTRRSVLRVEYLYGSFEPGFAEDELEQELDSSHLFAAQISVEF